MQDGQLTPPGLEASFPTTGLVALSFRLFGAGLWQGRLPIALCALGAMHVDVPPVAAIWLVVISSMSLLLPIAVNGIGVVESVYLLILASYGVAPSVGISVALVVRVSALLVSLAGGILMLNRRMIELEAQF